jgi:DNA-binding response OmpR family regulator
MGRAPKNSSGEIGNKAFRDTYYRKIEGLISCGIEFVLAKPLNRITVEGILFRYVMTLSDHLSSYNFKKYHGIYLNEKSDYVIFNDCKIFLSDTETALLSLLMKEGRYLRCEDIKRGLENKTDKTYKQESVRIYVQRIREKFLTHTGINIIGNRYSRGYYITV